MIVGFVNVDLVVATERLRARRDRAGPRLERYGGGKGANAAVAAARLGAEARLVAAVGDDALGRDALAELGREGVDVGEVSKVSGEVTGAALIVVDGSGDNQIAVGAGANAALAPDRVRRVLEGALNRAGCLLSAWRSRTKPCTPPWRQGESAEFRSSSSPRRRPWRPSSSPRSGRSSHPTRARLAG